MEGCNTCFNEAQPSSHFSCMTMVTMALFYIYTYIHTYVYIYICIYICAYIRTHVYMDHQREVSLQTLMALGNLEVVNMSSALLRGKTADAPKPGSKALAHGTGVIQEPWGNFIIIHTFTYLFKMDVCIYIYMYLYMSLVVLMQHVKAEMFLHDS